MSHSLFAISKLNYRKVRSPHLPARPGRMTVFVGKPFSGKPEHLDQYVKYGYSFSEKRKREIHSRFTGKQFMRCIVSNIFGSGRPVIILNETT